MKYNIKVIKHRDQRYDTVGDWYYNIDNDTLFITVSEMGDARYEFLVILHEKIEAMLCIQRNINEKDVTQFDLWYEQKRLKKIPSCQGEPGDHLLAPYRKEHFFATSLERLMAAELGVLWEDYDAAVMAL